MEPKEILKIWSQYFNEGNLNSIVNLYDKDSILFPTFSNQILSDREMIKEYFHKVLIYQKVSVEINFESVSEKKLEENFFLLTGYYVFNFTKKRKVPARYSFIINLFKDPLIKHHHSSRIPKD
tara:strand:- start:2182 stop:2550 length:369 start_codon:yes stop_codon:yes gene_type:complete